MTTYVWPTDGSLYVAGFDLMVSNNNVVFTSPLSGATQTVSLPGQRWGWGVTFPAQPYASRRVVEAFLGRLSGMEHRCQMYDVARPVPAGTITTTSKALTVGAAQFATSLTFNATTGHTMKAGDWLRLTLDNGLFQLCMVMADATAAASAITVEIRPPLRGAAAIGKTVVLDKPTGLFVMKEPDWASMRSGGDFAPRLSVEFREVFS